MHLLYTPHTTLTLVLSAPIYLSNSPGVFGHRAILMWGDRGMAGGFPIEQTDMFQIQTFFLPPTQREGSSFLVRVVKYWNNLPASVVTAPSVKIFKKIFPIDRNFPNFLSLPHPNCTPPINSPHLYMLPKSLFCLCGFLMFVVAYF